MVVSSLSHLFLCPRTCQNDTFLNVYRCRYYMVFECCPSHPNVKLEKSNILNSCVHVGARSAAWALFGVLVFLNVTGAAAWCFYKHGFLIRYF